jgi:hypothetical protein
MTPPKIINKKTNKTHFFGFLNPEGKARIK